MVLPCTTYYQYTPFIGLKEGAGKKFFSRISLVTGIRPRISSGRVCVLGGGLPYVI